MFFEEANEQISSNGALKAAPATEQQLSTSGANTWSLSVNKQKSRAKNKFVHTQTQTNTARYRETQRQTIYSVYLMTALIASVVGIERLRIRTARLRIQTTNWPQFDADSHTGKMAEKLNEKKWEMQSFYNFFKLFSTKLNNNTNTLMHTIPSKCARFYKMHWICTCIFAVAWAYGMNLNGSYWQMQAKLITDPQAGSTMQAKQVPEMGRGEAMKTQRKRWM